MGKNVLPRAVLGNVNRDSRGNATLPEKPEQHQPETGGDRVGKGGSPAEHAETEAHGYKHPAPSEQPETEAHGFKHPAPSEPPEQ